jgi:glycosyltransferase involved in cell wall biosynthesis
MRRPIVAAVPKLLISVVITVHNEGDELRRTIESVRQNTLGDCEIIVVDDGSTDGCCENADLEGVRLIRHEARVGVACSRHEASGVAKGTALAFLDGHQRVERGALEECAELALERNAIVWPDVSGLEEFARRVHGAYFTLSRKPVPFSAEWKSLPPSKRVTPISALRAPGYVIPKSVYLRVSWIGALRGWGGSEAAVSVKAFFAGVDILHLCGPLIRHQFKKSFSYEVRWPEVWRNHALIARVCFDERTWHDYWLPEVFAPHLTAEARADIESASVLAEHEAFQKIKTRPDREFWTDLVFRDLPTALR